MQSQQSQAPAFISTDPATAATGTPVWKKSPGGSDRFINSVAVSADGSRVIGGTFHHTYSASVSRRAPAPVRAKAAVASDADTGTFGTYCYNASGAQVWKNEFQGWQGVYWVAISADGAKAASGGLMTQKTPTKPQAGFVRAFDGATGSVLLDYATAERVNQVALSSDGTWLVSAAETLLLFKYDATSGQYALTDTFVPPAPPPGNWNGIVSTAISSDGMTVLYADYNGNLGVFANQAGTLVLQKGWKLPGTSKSDFCHMVALTSDATAFAAGGAAGVFYYFNVASFIASGTPTYTYSTGFNEAVYGVAVAENGAMFAGVVNQGVAGRAYLIGIVNNAPAQTTQCTLLRNPNSASLNSARGLFAVADGHPDGTPGHFYLYSGIGAPGQGGIILRWICTTGNMSWPVVISASGNAVVGGSDDSFIYYFTP